MAGVPKAAVQRLLELLFGRIPGSGPPTPAQEAAGAIFLALSKAVGAPGEHDQRTIDEILDELVTTSDMIEATYWHYGAEAGKSARDGNLTVEEIVYRLRDDIIAPRLDEWRPKLRAHLATRKQLTIAESEAEWQERDACRSSLDDMRLQARPYLDTLAGLSGSRAAAQRSPEPPSKVIDVTVLEAPFEPVPEGRPNRTMVRWFDPVAIDDSSAHASPPSPSPLRGPPPHALRATHGGPVGGRFTAC